MALASLLTVTSEVEFPFQGIQKLKVSDCLICARRRWTDRVYFCWESIFLPRRFISKSEINLRDLRLHAAFS